MHRRTFLRALAAGSLMALTNTQRIGVLETWMAAHKAEHTQKPLHTHTPPPDPPPTTTRPFPAPVTARTIAVPTTLNGSTLNAWLAGQPDGSIIDFDAVDYAMPAGLAVIGKQNLVLRGHGTKLVLSGDGAKADSSAFFLRGSSHVSIEGTWVTDGQDTTPTALGGKENAHVLALSGWYGLGPSSFVEITGVTASRIYGDFAYLEGRNATPWEPSANVWVHGNKATGIGRNALSIIDATDVLCEDNDFDEIGMDVVDFEPNFAGQVGKRVTFRGNRVGAYARMTAFEGWLLNTWNIPLIGPEDITITDNDVAGNPASGNSGSKRGLHVLVDHAGRPKRIAVTNNRTGQTAPGPVMQFVNADGVTVQGNVQPLTSGVLATFSGCTGVVQ